MMLNIVQYSITIKYFIIYCHIKYFNKSFHMIKQLYIVYMPLIILKMLLIIYKVT